MRLQFIICKVLQGEAYLCAAHSNNTIDVVLVPQGLHNEPDKLCQEVQKALAVTSDIQGRPYDATLLGYGLCSNGIVGLHCDIPLVVPRGHDCVTLLLGSRKAYQDYFDSQRGVYWYSCGWIESNTMPGRERYELTLKEYADKYGTENAEYLMQMEQNWMKEYSYATFINWDMPDADKHRRYTQECAEFMKWNYDELRGDSGLMQRLLDGKWDENEFLVVKPGQCIAEDLTEETIIKAKELDDKHN